MHIQYGGGERCVPPADQVHQDLRVQPECQLQGIYFFCTDITETSEIYC